MRFQVHTPSGVEDYAGGARYQVELMGGGGVLAVWPTTAGGWCTGRLAGTG